jgi:hypothetical protein
MPRLPRRRCRRPSLYFCVCPSEHIRNKLDCAGLGGRCLVVGGGGGAVFGGAGEQLDLGKKLGCAGLCRVGGLGRWASELVCLVVFGCLLHLGSLIWVCILW